MEKKTLYMIGNSHIDPVWFWNWEEGMQEVKATYASALERMKEFEEFKFTVTSTAFFEWLEAVVPQMFEEIRQRVKEGRIELTGGWFIEPDCILPCGEALVRQGLYSQRYLLDRFGKICKIGSNVDSFGHNHMLPQILKKSGMDAYVFMRPRLDTPLFLWESDDGSRVRAICLPGEYTTWFHEPTVKNIEKTLERTKDYNKMPCCYGVGNHGGGPTIENIESIQALKDSFPGTKLRFGTYTEFLEDAKEQKLPVRTGPFEKVNIGCYSIDSAFKSLYRLAEARLLAADHFMAMASCIKDSWMNQTEEMEGLWKILLFNEFHDTMGGTTIRNARDEAMMQMSAVCAQAEKIRVLAIQAMVNELDTRGEGFPLFLFNPGGQAVDDYVETELEWFCQSPLKLLNPEGEEIPYQRIHTDAKVRHTDLGGRRRFVFRAQLLPFGFAMYRTLKEEPALCCNNQMEIDRDNPLLLENAFIRAEFNGETGELQSLFDKEQGYEALKGPVSLKLYIDERDAWGGLQDRRYEERNISFLLDSIEKAESGALRECIRVRSHFEGTFMEQLYYLGGEEKEIRVENRLRFAHTWSLIKLALPLSCSCREVLAETAYGTLKRRIGDTDEYYMQRFADAVDEDGRGLAIANSGKYAFNCKDGSFQITAARSAIYAQGSSPDWYNEKESYQYTDIGEQTFFLVLKPHGAPLPVSELYRIAGKINSGPKYLADSSHPGKKKLARASFAAVDKENVELVLIKKAEDDASYIIRLLETEGKNTACMLKFCSRTYPIRIGYHEILTLKLDRNGQAETVDLLERKEGMDE